MSVKFFAYGKKQPGVVRGSNSGFRVEPSDRYATPTRPLVILRDDAGNSMVRLGQNGRKIAVYCEKNIITVVMSYTHEDRIAGF